MELVAPSFDDGNIILKCGNSGFRIHRSVISRASTVFDDMFGLSDHHHGDVTMGECPVIEVHDDTQDLRNILLGVYKAQFFPYLNANTLTSYLKLGKKYDMPFLYQEALFCMRSEFPSDLESFAHTVRGASVRNIPRHQFMYYNNSDLIPLANIVFDIGALDAFLAVVIRLSCVHDYTAIVSESQTPLAPELESLVIKCQGDAEKMIQDAMSYPTPSCKSSGCKTDEEDWWTKKKWSLFRPHIFHPVTPGEYFRGQICPVCITAAKKSWKDVRYKWWMSLPSTLGFDIPKWGKKRTVLELQGELGCFFCEMRCQV